MQTVFAECPVKSKLNYKLQISILDWSPEDYVVFLQQPGSEAMESKVSDDSILVERSDGPGVWRFNAVVRSRKNPDDIADVLTVESVIFPEAHAAAQAAVEERVAAMNLVITGDGSVMQGNTDVSADAAKLYSSYGESATLEILRKLALNRQNQNDILRCLCLLEFSLNRSSAKWLMPFAMPVLCEVASSTNKWSSTSTVQRLIKGALLAPNEKWIYLMRLALEAPDGKGLANIISELGHCTPIEYRSQTAAMILELSSGRGSTQREAANLCLTFGYAPGAPIVMDWLQTNMCDIRTACKVFQMAEYREAIPYLRKLITKPGRNPDDDEIVGLLSEWHDNESIPLMLSKLEIAEDYAAERVSLMLLTAFGSTIAPQMKEIQNRCSPEKAKRIGQVMEKTLSGR
jgi:hypothetical protein